MRTNFNSTSIPTRAAKRLKELAGLKDSQAKQWTAYVLGYRDWHELQTEAGQWEASSLDEASNSANRAARRAYQLARLQECLAGHDDKALNAAHLLGKWQPSAARPQENAHSVETPEAWGTSRKRMEFIAILIAFGEGQHLPPEDIEEVLLTGIQNTTDKSHLSLAQHCSQTLVQRPEQASKKLARKLFEALSTRGHPEATQNLAVSLLTGDGGDKEPARAGALLQRLINSPDTPANVLLAAKAGYATFLAVHGSGSAKSKDKASKFWEETALAGDAQSAFNVALGTDPNHSKSANPANSAKFYRLAAKQGHVPSASNLGILLQTHRELCEHPLEGYEWLEFAAAKGNAPAIKGLKELDKHATSVMRKFDRGEFPEDKIREVQDMIVKMAMSGRGPSKN